MKLTNLQKILIVFTTLMVLFWFILLLSQQTDGFYNYLFSCLTNLIPMAGGIAAMVGVGSWTEEKGLIRKGMFFVGLGLVLYACGGFIWAYYNFFMNAAAPYPSVADLGFAPSEFFYCVGAVYLARAASADMGMQNKNSKWLVTLIALGMFVFTYYILVIVARHGVLVQSQDPAIKTFLDLAYPFGDFLAITISVSLSAIYLKYLGTRYRISMIAVIAGLTTLFAADSMFSYMTNQNTYYNGNSADLLFLLGLFLLSVGILGFSEPKTHQSK